MMKLPLLTLIRDFFRNHGLGKWVGELSDNDLRYLLSRAARAARKKSRAGVGNVRASLITKPSSVEDFLNMNGHKRPPRLNFSDTGEMFAAFKKYILDANIVTPEGYTLKVNDGHFFSFCCGKKDRKKKGFIDRATSAEDALRLVKNSLIKPEEMSGFELDRIRNIQTYVDVLTDPDFSYRAGKENKKIIYGKKI